MKNDQAARPAGLSTRALLVVCLAALAWAFSFGLGAPLAALWLNDAGFDYGVVGYNTGTYYLGMAIAAAFTPRLMRRWGSGCVVVGCLLTALTVAVFPFCGTLSLYFPARLANGIAGALRLIPLETYVNRDSADTQRSRNFGFYAFSVALGWALGNLVGLQMYADAPALAFVLGGAAALLAALAILTALPKPAQVEEPQKRSERLRLRRHFLSFGTAWSQGFLEGGMVGFLSLYLLAVGMNNDRVSWLTSGLMLGVILFQVPVGWLADRVGRAGVLLGCYAVVIVGLSMLPLCGDSIWLAFWLVLMGCCSGAFYPLGLTLLSERVPGSGLARANAWFMAINCLGSLMGPGIIGEVMDRFGKEAMFSAGLAAVVLVLGLWLALRFLGRGAAETHGALSTEEPRRAA